MKTTWYSMCAAALVGLMLTGCNNNPQKDKVDADKNAKVNAADNKGEAERDRVKREADAKQKEIDAASNRVEQNKDAKVDAINQKEKEEKDAAKREAEMKKDAIDAQPKNP